MTGAALDPPNRPPAPVCPVAPAPVLNRLFAPGLGVDDVPEPNKVAPEAAGFWASLVVVAEVAAACVVEVAVLPNRLVFGASVVLVAPNNPPGFVSVVGVPAAGVGADLAESRLKSPPLLAGFVVSVGLEPKRALGVAVPDAAAGCDPNKPPAELPLNRFVAAGVAVPDAAGVLGFALPNVVGPADPNMEGFEASLVVAAVACGPNSALPPGVAVPDDPVLNKLLAVDVAGFCFCPAPKRLVLEVFPKIPDAAGLVESVGAAPVEAPNTLPPRFAGGGAAGVVDAPNIPLCAPPNNLFGAGVVDPKIFEGAVLGCVGVAEPGGVATCVDPKLKLGAVVGFCAVPDVPPNSDEAPPVGVLAPGVLVDAPNVVFVDFPKMLPVPIVGAPLPKRLPPPVVFWPKRPAPD